MRGGGVIGFGWTERAEEETEFNTEGTEAERWSEAASGTPPLGGPLYAKVFCL